MSSCSSSNNCVRVRLNFDELPVDWRLSNSWYLVKTQHTATIEVLAQEIARLFHINFHPDILRLQLGTDLLPKFVSTEVLHEGDLIRVTVDDECNKTMKRISRNSSSCQIVEQTLKGEDIKICDDGDLSITRPSDVAVIAGHDLIAYSIPPEVFSSLSNDTVVTIGSSVDGTVADTANISTTTTVTTPESTNCRRTGRRGRPRKQEANKRKRASHHDGLRATTDAVKTTECSGNAFACKDCGEVYTHPGMIHIHRRGDTVRKRYKCEVCERSFIMLKDCKAHMQTHDSRPRYRCPLCPQSFRLRLQLERHKPEHASDGKPGTTPKMQNRADEVCVGSCGLHHTSENKSCDILHCRTLCDSDSVQLPVRVRSQGSASSGSSVHLRPANLSNSAGQAGSGFSLRDGSTTILPGSANPATRTSGAGSGSLASSAPRQALNHQYGTRLREKNKPYGLRIHQSSVKLAKMSV